MPETMAGMRVALVQFASVTDSATNRANIVAQLAALTHDELDLVVLPEGAMHDFGPTNHDLSAVAEPLDGPFVQILSTEARRLNTTIIAGMFEQGDELPYNTLVVMGADGALAATYRKIHLYDSFGYRESDRLSAGEVAPVVVDIRGTSVGLMTCYDLRFPEHARALVDGGAELMVVPAAWVEGELKLHHWRTLLTARAIENVAFVVAAAQCGERYVGHSMIVDPSGTVVTEADAGDAIVQATLDLDKVARAREANPSLANRRIRS